MPHCGDSARIHGARPSRRALLAAAGGVVLLGAGCGGGTGSQPEGAPFVGTPERVAPVPGAAGRWAGRTLRVSAFGGEVEEALRALLWEPFARHTGCAIESAAVSFAPAAATPVADDGTPSFALPLSSADLVLADPIAASAAAERGDLTDLSADVVPDAAVGRLSGSPAAPAFAYALVNARHRGAFPEGSAPTSWTEWWDTDGLPGARSLGRSPIGTLEVALLADGVAPRGLYPLDIGRALASLGRVVEAVGERWWNRGIEPVGWLGTGRAELASAWHHRVVAGQWDGLAVDLEWEGGILVVDQWVVPAGAREPEVAVDLIRFALSPERQAAFARETRLGPVVPDALQWIEPWLLPTIPTAPPHDGRLVPLDPAWWATAGGEARTEFDGWLAAVLG